MTIKEIKYKIFDLKFLTAFASSRTTIKERKVVILYAKTDNGKTILGEASPLNGFSKESVTEIENKLDRLSKFLINISPENLDEIIETEEIASLTFAFEQIADTIKFLTGERIPETIEIKVNPLFTIDSIREEKMLQFRNSAIKIKFGFNSFEEEMHKIMHLEAALMQAGIKTRIDPNGKWTATQTRIFTEALNPKIIDYIEQPTHQIDELLKLLDEGLPIAFDESLNEIDSLNAVLSSAPIALVVKPTVFGGFKKLKKLLSSKKHRIVISSALESDIAWHYLARIASEFPNEFHGLHTFNLFVTQPHELQANLEVSRVKTIYPQNILEL